MPDPLTVTAVLYAASLAVGDATVKAVTKDAYSKAKQAIVSFFGKRGSKALAKLDASETRDDGLGELKGMGLDTLSQEEREEIGPLVVELIERLREDDAGKAVAHSRLGLDLDVGSDALIREISGVREMVVNAKTSGSFTLEGVKMDTGRDPGK